MNSSKFDKALITGASSGIGEALAYRIAAEGIPLILIGRNEGKLTQVAKQLPVEVQVIAADLVNREERQLVIDAIHRQQPQLIVNNAGQGLYGEAAEHDTRRQMEILDLNAGALQELTLESIKMLKKAGKKGAIMNISSAAAFQVFPYFAVYSATKAFVNQLSESLDAEERENGIRVLAACPGMVATNFRSRSGGKTNPDERSSKMTAEFAASEIWNQIVSGKSIRAFDWRYRLATFLSKWIIPKGMIVSLLKKRIRSFIERD